MSKLSIEARVDALDSLLDGVLNEKSASELAREHCRMCGLKGSAAMRHRAALAKRYHASRAENAVLQAVRGGARTWKQIQILADLDDDTLGFALSNLIPSRLKTRDEGDGRYYFLPRDQRRLRQSAPHHARRWPAF